MRIKSKIRPENQLMKWTISQFSSGSKDFLKLLYRINVILLRTLKKKKKREILIKCIYVSYKVKWITRKQKECGGKGEIWKRGGSRGKVQGL